MTSELITIEAVNEFNAINQLKEAKAKYEKVKSIILNHATHKQ